jgi:hypothetical protein
MTNSLGPHLYDKIISMSTEIEGNYLEIGTYNGSGVSTIAKKLLEKKIYVIDPFIEDGNTQRLSNTPLYEKMNSVKNEFLNNTKGLDNIHHFENTTEEVSTTLTPEEILNMNVSMILIDGDHHTDFVTIDYEFAMNLIGEKSGFIIFDDLHVPDVMLAYENFIEKYKNRIEFIDKFYMAANLVKIKKSKTPKTVFFTIISDSHYHGCRTDDFIKSFKKFHPDVDLVVFGQDDIDEMFASRPELNFYNSKASFAKKLYNDYDLVVNIDADHLIFGRLDEILEGDYDVAAPTNFNVYANSSLETSTLCNGYVVPPSVLSSGNTDTILVPQHKYLQAGLIASTSKLFWDQYENACIKFSHFFGHYENDVLNIICHMLPYKLKVLEGDFVFTSPNFTCYYGCASLGRENQVVVNNNRLELDGRPFKAYHFARGGSNKPLVSELFTQEVDEFVKRNVLDIN